MSGIFINWPEEGGSGGGGLVGSVSAVYVVGPLDGRPASPNGASIGSSALYLQTATPVNPGLVSSSDQSFMGTKTFLAGVAVSGLVSSGSLQSQTITASGLGTAPVRSNSGLLINGSTSLTAEVSGVLPVANGGTGTASPQYPTSVGAIDAAAASANGAVIGSNSLFMQSASPAVPGLVNNGAQFFSGIKTFGAQIGVSHVVASSDGIFSLGSISLANGSRFANLYLTREMTIGNLLVGGGVSTGSAAITMSLTRGPGPSPAILIWSGSGNAYGLGNDGTDFYFYDLGLASRFFKANRTKFDFENASTNVQYFCGSTTAVQAVKIPMQFSGVTSGYQGLKGADSGDTYQLQFPNSIGTASYVMATNGLGSLTWVSALTNPMTTSGDIIVASASGVVARLAGATSNSISFLTQVGDGTNSAPPTWRTTGVPIIKTLSTSTGTYTVSAGVRYIRVRMLGGGGGGGGSGTGSIGSAAAGGQTSLSSGSFLIFCNGGGGGSAQGPVAGALGGSCTVGSSAYGIALQGSGSAAGTNFGINTVSPSGAAGAAGALGGGTPGTGGGNAGANALANSGSGGSAGNSGGVTSNIDGAAGAAGGYVDCIVPNPSGVYNYTIGGGGTAGAAGTSGFAGGNGGSGVIYIEECYL